MENTSLEDSADVRVSIIIPYAGGQPEWLERQVAALEASIRNSGLRESTCDIIISCNDRRGAESAQAVVSRNDSGPEVIFVDSSRVRGPSHARNVGASIARGAFFLFCDADDVVDDGWVGAMVRALEISGMTAGALSFSGLNPNRDSWWRSSADPELGTKFGHLPFGVSANLGLRREVFSEIGGFDENLTVGEDVDICWRGQYRGESLRFAPEAIVHYRLRSGRSAQLRQAYAYGKGDAVLLQVHRGRGARRSVGEGIRATIGVVALLGVSMVRPKFRAKARYRLGHLAGRAIGSLRLRVWAV